MLGFEAILPALVLLVPGLLGLAIPALTELITKVYAPDGVKSAVVIALSLLAAVVPTVPVAILGAGTLASVSAYLVAVLVAWLTSGRAYLAGMANKAAMAAPDSGIGPEVPNGGPLESSEH